MSTRNASHQACDAFVAAFRVPGDLLPDDGTATNAMRRTLTTRYGTPKWFPTMHAKFWDLANGLRTPKRDAFNT